MNVVKPWMNATLQMLHSLVATLQQRCKRCNRCTLYFNGYLFKSPENAEDQPTAPRRLYADVPWPYLN